VRDRLRAAPIVGVGALVGLDTMATSTPRTSKPVLLSAEAAATIKIVTVALAVAGELSSQELSVCGQAPSSQNASQP
jgi:hypothetical protein